MTEMTKPSLEDPEESFREINAMKYYVIISLIKNKKKKINEQLFFLNLIDRFKEKLNYFFF